MRDRWLRCLGGLALVFTVGKAVAEEHTMSRAGCPENISRCARPSQTPAYDGYYVGGGSACGGSCRTREQGTWGWDYRGYLLPRRVILAWTNGRRYQGGTGAYRTDGGPEIPDVPGFLGSTLSRHKRGEKSEE